MGTRVSNEAIKHYATPGEVKVWSCKDPALIERIKGIEREDRVIIEVGGHDKYYLDKDEALGLMIHFHKAACRQWGEDWKKLMEAVVQL